MEAWLSYTYSTTPFLLLLFFIYYNFFKGSAILATGITSSKWKSRITNINNNPSKFNTEDDPPFPRCNVSFSFFVAGNENLRKIPIVVFEIMKGIYFIEVHM